jgi:hypothetical protein
MQLGKRIYSGIWLHCGRLCRGVLPNAGGIGTGEQPEYARAVEIRQHGHIIRLDPLGLDALNPDSHERSAQRTRADIR